MHGAKGDGESNPGEQRSCAKRLHNNQGRDQRDSGRGGGRGRTCDTIGPPRKRSPALQSKCIEGSCQWGLDETKCVKVREGKRAAARRYASEGVSRLERTGLSKDDGPFDAR